MNRGMEHTTAINQIKNKMRKAPSICKLSLAGQPTITCGISKNWIKQFEVDGRSFRTWYLSNAIAVMEIVETWECNYWDNSSLHLKRGVSHKYASSLKSANHFAQQRAITWKGIKISISLKWGDDGWCLVGLFESSFSFLVYATSFAKLFWV